MRRNLGWIAIAWLVLVCAVALMAYGNRPTPLSLDDRVRAVAQQLRCPQCNGESVADSPANISASIRTDIRRRLLAGQSQNQIKQFYVSRYGDWILLSPPQTGIGGVAWLAPPLLVLGGLGLLLTLVTDWRRRGRGGAPVSSERYLERVRAELAADHLSE